MFTSAWNKPVIRLNTGDVFGISSPGWKIILFMIWSWDVVFFLFSIWVLQGGEGLFQKQSPGQKVKSQQGHRCEAATLPKKYYSQFVLQDHKNSLSLWCSASSLCVGARFVLGGLQRGRQLLLCLSAKLQKCVLSCLRGAQQSGMASRNQTQWSRIRTESQREADNIISSL